MFVFLCSGDFPFPCSSASPNSPAAVLAWPCCLLSNKTGCWIITFPLGFPRNKDESCRSKPYTCRTPLAFLQKPSNCIFLTNPNCCLFGPITSISFDFMNSRVIYAMLPLKLSFHLGLSELFLGKDINTEIGTQGYAKCPLIHPQLPCDFTRLLFPSWHLFFSTDSLSKNVNCFSEVCSEEWGLVIVGEWDLQTPRLLLSCQMPEALHWPTVYLCGGSCNLYQVPFSYRCYLLSLLS